jgi:hypothetical protein
MYLHRPHTLTLEVRRKEELSRCVAINKDGVIADCAGQDVGDRTEDREGVFLEQEGRARSIS